MDITLFKLDIDELLDEFAQNGFTSLEDMKLVWKDRKFSYIYEASPTTHIGLFMQSLYGHTLGRMIFGSTLSHRLAGLYCLYCLYETQLFKPPFKVYLSLGDLEHLKNLAADANKRGITVVSHLIKRMLNNRVFLIGLVDINEASTQERVTELTKMQNAQASIAYKKLFENTEIQRFLEFDMVTTYGHQDAELGMDEIRKLTAEYASAKKMAIGEASQVVNVQDIEHIAENKKHIGEVMDHIDTKWKEQKELFHQQTSSQHNLCLPIEPASGPDQQLQEGEIDDFDQELRRLLSIPE